MFQIIVASNEKTFEQLTQILKQFFEMSIITSECIRIKKSCEIMVIRANSIKNLNVDRGVLVVSDCSNIVLNECVCPIVIAEGNKVFSCGKFDSKTQYITCGMRGKDTISFSSIDIDEVSVSLMRELKDLNGNTVEPFEVTVCSKTDISKYSLFSILSAITLITILGKTINGLKLYLE